MIVDELRQLAPNSINLQNVEVPVRVQSKSKLQQLMKQDHFIADETGMC